MLLIFSSLLQPTAGALAASDIADAATLAGLVIDPGALAASETPDGSSLTGLVIDPGALAASETPDTAALSGAVGGGAGALAASDVADGATLAGTVRDPGALAASDVADSAALSGSVSSPTTGGAGNVPASASRTLKAGGQPFAGDYPKFSPWDSEPFALDFALRLASGDAIASVAASVSVHYGADPLAASRLVGTPYYSGTVATQRLSGLLAGVVYNLIITVTTADGDVLANFGRVSCVAIS